ncbi:hypothetical protein EZV62_023542 [Acer yangbiense]|uniref:Histone deacetylase complex subunit SAP18 n=1 Tax=Acer yangbiense TaxID=1000413 RepID=A0A5C7H209_9ROSI|nr:hypothetical protein EZV62_023542 [Acer yangbiense]
MAAAPQSHNRPGSGRPFHPQNRPHLQPPRPRAEPVDREKTCPLLLRVFTKIESHHTPEDFAVRGKEPKDEVQIYTWKDATLRELTDLVKEVAPEARRRNAKLSFAFVYPDKRGRFVLRQSSALVQLKSYVTVSCGKKQIRCNSGVGMTHSYGNGRRLDDSRALAELNFEIGDYLDVAIL